MLIVAEMDFLRSAVALQARNLEHMKSRDRSAPVEWARCIAQRTSVLIEPSS